MSVNRTLYVGGLHPSDDAEEVVARHFEEWGPIQCTRVPGAGSRGIAFVTYTTEAYAQFAKEAMAYQCSDHNETLSLRWSMPDPNPVTRARLERELEERAADAIRAASATRSGSANSSREIETSEAGLVDECEGTEHNLILEQIKGQGVRDSPSILPSSTLQKVNNLCGNVLTLPLRQGTKRKLVDYTSDDDEEE